MIKKINEASLMKAIEDNGYEVLVNDRDYIGYAYNPKTGDVTADLESKANDRDYVSMYHYSDGVICYDDMKQDFIDSVNRMIL